MHEDTMSVVFDVLEGGDKRRQCEQCGQPSPCTSQDEKVWQMPRGIILLQRVSTTRMEGAQAPVRSEARHWH